MTTKNARQAARIIALVLVVSAAGIVGTAHGTTGVLQAVIVGARVAPVGMSSDGRITLRLGIDLPVFLVSGGARVPGQIATATFAQLSDTARPSGFGPSSTVMVFRLFGGPLVVAAGIDTPDGFITTFSSTAPYARLRGNWVLVSGAGVAGVTPGDALVTFTFDTDPDSEPPPALNFAAKGGTRPGASKGIPGVGTVDVRGDIPVTGGQNSSLIPKNGMLTSYTIYDIANSSERVELNAITFDGGLSGDVYLLYVCARQVGASVPTCLVGGSEGQLIFFLDPTPELISICFTCISCCQQPSSSVSDLSGQFRQIASPSAFSTPTSGITTQPFLPGFSTTPAFFTVEISSSVFVSAVESLGQAGVVVTSDDLVLQFSPSLF